MRTRKVKASGKFRASYGSKVRERYAKIDSKQRKKQPCPFCKKDTKRLSKGIWQCKKCKRKFTSHAYYLE